MSVDIRHVEADQVVAWMRTMRTTFLMQWKEPTQQVQSFFRRTWGDPRRRYGAYEGERLVATLATFPTTITVPGYDGTTAEVTADALTMVTVAATHRRQGLLTRMLTQSLHDAKDRGEAISILRAAEYPIYGRFGYCPASYSAMLRVDAGRKPRLLVEPKDVIVEQCEPADLVKPGQDIYDEARRLEHGHIARERDVDWARPLALEGLESDGAKAPTCVVARDGEDRAVGFALWNPGTFTGDWFDSGVPIVVPQLMATTADAYAALWRYLLGIDLIGTIEMPERPVDDPIQHMLTDGRAAQPHRIYDATWVRLLDVPAALSGRSYASGDQLVLEVSDEDAGRFATGTYTLDASLTGASCSRTPGATPDLRLSQRALAGLYLSGRTVWSMQRCGLLEEVRPGAARRFQRLLFHERAPFNATPF